LTEATDLSELFERDPLQLTNDDIASIIAVMRQHLAQFELGIKKPVAERKRTSKATDLLKELGLDKS